MYKSEVEYKTCILYLSILHNNICSLPLNFHKMEELFIASSKLPNILAFSETKLNASSSVPHLKGFNFERNDSTSAAGGVALYLSEKIQYTVNNELALNLPHCEDLWVTITNDSSSSSKPNTLEKLVIAVIYRHPGRKYDEFREKLCDQLLSLDRQKIKYYIVGDMNIDLLKYNIASNVTNYLNAIHASGCNVFIDKPTRITSHSATCIDHVYSNLSTDKLNNFIIEAELSDHFGTLTKIESLFNHSKKTEEKGDLY